VTRANVPGVVENGAIRVELTHKGGHVTLKIVDCLQTKPAAGFGVRRFYTDRKSKECNQLGTGVCQPSGINSKLSVRREANSS
jgi:hypothetical protein